MNLRRLCLIFWLVVMCGSVGIYAQKTKTKKTTDEDNGEILVDLEDDGPPPLNGYRHQLNVEITAPHYFMNRANAMSFNGIIQANIWYSAKIAGNFRMGPYIRYTGFEFYAGRPNQANPLVTHLSAGLNMSYEIMLGERFMYQPSLFLGAGYIQYNNLSLPIKGVEYPPRTTWTDWGFTAQTNQSFYYYVKQNRKIAVGLILGLNFNTHEFNLKRTGLSGDATVNSYSDEGPTLMGNVGFGLLMNFGKIKNVNR